MADPSHDLTTHRDVILSWLRAREDAMASLLAELVAIPSENPPGKNYRACVDLLQCRSKQMGLDCERLGPFVPAVNAEDSPECLVAFHGNGERTLYFHGHYDVVPAQAHEQFRPVRKDHFLFGRGSGDMKGGIAAMVYAISALKELQLDLGGRIVLTLVPNEETGGEGGTASLAREGLLDRNGTGMLLAEPTSGVLWSSNRGAISLRVRVFGKAAHVGLQHRGENAFERMHRVAEKLQQLKHKAEQRTTKHNIGAEQMPNSILMVGGESGGGTNFNVVPAECWFTVDRRINPEENLAAEKEVLLDVLKDCQRSGIPLEWEILQEGDSAWCDEEAPLGRALSDSVRAVTGQAPRFEMCPGLLETRFYAALGVPAYAYGPGLLSVAHGPNEYVDLRKIVDTAAIYALAALLILRS